MDALSSWRLQLNTVGARQQQARHRQQSRQVIQAPPADHRDSDGRVLHQPGEQVYDLRIGVDVFRCGRKIGQRAVIVQEQL